MSALQELQRCIGYEFNDQDLLFQALSHRSFGSKHNERLEFLGDSVLGLIIALALYQQCPSATEGELSRLRASLVNGDVLSVIAEKIGVNACLNLGSGELKNGGRKRPSILADAVEAIIAAIFLEAGMETCRRCVLDMWKQHGPDWSGGVVEKDPKSRLQEWLQARQRPLPEYALRVSGEAHAQQFFVTCSVEGLDYQATGSGTSRRKAEQMAARQFWEWVNEQA